MKASTKRKKQLARVSEWLKKARPSIEERVVIGGWNTEFNLLIAAEQLVEYCKLLEAELDARKRSDK